MRMLRHLSLLGALGLLCGAFAVSGQPDEVSELRARGEQVYQTSCAACHDNPEGRTPSRSFLRQTRNPGYILRALTNGVMRDIAAHLSDEDKRAVATFLIGRPPGDEVEVDPRANMCTRPPPPMAPGAGDWNGWSGRGTDNRRFHPESGLSAGELPQLQLKWAFAYPGGVSNEPAVVGGRMFVSNMAGILYALDAESGCTYWTRDLGEPSRTMVTVGALPDGRHVAYATAWYGTVYALDVDSGAIVWQTRVDEHPAVRLTGSPVLHEGRLYVPISSGEEALAPDPSYQCCSFRGALAALDAATGMIMWKTHTIDEPPAPLPDGHRLGPSGAAIWSAPTIDPERGLVYAVTGDDYSNPVTPVSDAVIAFDLQSGAKRWVSQVLPGDTFVGGCSGGEDDHINCPDDLGPDYDLGASPVLMTTSEGKDVLVAMSKGGIAYGLDVDDNGRILWELKLGRGGLMGGVQWGAASDGERLYVPISDTAFIGGPGEVGATFPLKPGLNAISPAGELLWHVPAPEGACAWEENCVNAFSAAPVAIPGAVIAGAFDGHIRAYASDTGALLWDFDTGREFQTVNGVPASGGSIDHGAQTVANGVLYVNSGGRQGRPGNVLLAFTAEGN